MLTTQSLTKRRATGATALLLATTMAAPLVLVRPTLAQNPIERFRNMSTRKKLVLLAGAAALAYMYKRHRDANNRPANVQYYQSRNGRIYYRDPRTHQAIWVTPPSGGLQVPYNDSRAFRRYQGYNNATTGRAFGGYGS